MVNRPLHINQYEFVALCALRAQQLLAGCVPRLGGDHNAATMAQMEVAAGHVSRMLVANGTTATEAPSPAQTDLK